MRRLSFTFTLAAALPAVLPLAAQAQVPRVVTDIPPIQSLVDQVMGDLGTAEVLLSQGSDPHHYQLRPSQSGALQDADLVFWVGPRLTPWLDRALEGFGKEGDAVALLEAPGTHTRRFSAEDAYDHSADLDDDDHDHGHDDDHGHMHGAEDGHDPAAEADHDDHDHAHAEADPYLDPHAWLDPGNASVWIGVIAKDLARTDPGNAATYEANARAAQARIAKMDAELKTLYAPVAEKPFLVYHAAYGYLADHYRLHIAGSVSPGDAASPGAAHLSSLLKRADAHNAVCAFPEAQHDPRMVSVLVDGTAVKLGKTLDPSGTSLTYGPDLYETLMRDIAETITSCLSNG